MGVGPRAVGPQPPAVKRPMGIPAVSSPVRRRTIPLTARLPPLNSLRRNGGWPKSSGSHATGTGFCSAPVADGPTKTVRSFGIFRGLRVRVAGCHLEQGNATWFHLRRSCSSSLGADDPPVVGGCRLAAVLGTGGMGSVYLRTRRAAGPSRAQGDPAGVRLSRSGIQSAGSSRRGQLRAAGAGPLHGARHRRRHQRGSSPGWPPRTSEPLARARRRPARRAAAAQLPAAHGRRRRGAARDPRRGHRAPRPQPANVLLAAADGPRVIDSGASPARPTPPRSRAPACPSARQHFMAPCRRRPAPSLPATDVFALGQITAFAAIGRPAFGEGSRTRSSTASSTRTPDLSQLPDELRPLVTHCLSRDPADRPSLDRDHRAVPRAVPDPAAAGRGLAPADLRQLHHRAAAAAGARTDAAARRDRADASPADRDGDARASAGRPARTDRVQPAHAAPSPYAHTAPHQAVPGHAPHQTPCRGSGATRRPRRSGTSGYAPPQGPGMVGRPWRRRRSLPKKKRRARSSPRSWWARSSCWGSSAR